MARITAPEATRSVNVDILEEDEPYIVSLKRIELAEQAEQYGGGFRLQLDWELPDSDGDTIRDWVGLRLGKQKAGGVSKLRQLLNAINEQPADTEVKWFDTDTMEWGYEAKGPAANALILGTVVQIRGSFRTKEDGSHRFVIDKYQTPKAKRSSSRSADAATADKAAAMRKRAQADDDVEDVPF